VDSGSPALPDGFSLRRFGEVGSTMDEARALAEAGAGEGTVVWALRQTAGRGRQGRRWVSPAGNCYSTIVLRPACAAAEAARLSFLVSIAVAEAVTLAVDPGRQVRVACKWPNDVLADGRKIAGILLESRGGQGAAVDWLLAGVGINVAAFPADTPYPACAVRELGGAVDAGGMLELYLGRLAAWLEVWRREGFAPVRRAWLERAWGLGDRIEVRLANGELRGIFEGLDESGALILGLDEGGQRHVTAGDVYRAA